MNYYKLNNLLNWITTIFFILNNILNWIFVKQFWIMFWIESILDKIQILNWISLGIGHGYREVVPSLPVYSWKYPAIVLVAYEHLFEPGSFWQNAFRRHMPFILNKNHWIWMIYALLSQDFVVRIYALFPLNLLATYCKQACSVVLPSISVSEPSVILLNYVHKCLVVHVRYIMFISLPVCPLVQDGKRLKHEICLERYFGDVYKGSHITRGINVIWWFGLHILCDCFSLETLVSSLANLFFTL